MDLVGFFLLRLFAALRQAHTAARLAAVLAERAVRAGVFLENGFIVHIFSICAWMFRGKAERKMPCW